MRRWISLMFAGLVLATSCSSKQPTAQSAPPLTERQRDSVLAKSSLPGATVVGRAISISDQAAKAAAQPQPETTGDGSD